MILTPFSSNSYMFFLIYNIISINCRVPVLGFCNYSLMLDIYYVHLSVLPKLKFLFLGLKYSYVANYFIIYV